MSPKNEKYLNCDLVVDKLASRANMKFRIVNFHLHDLEKNIRKETNGQYNFGC